MTSETSPYPEAPRPTRPIEERGGWTGSDLAIGGAVIVLLIALFLPWFSTSAGAGTTDGLSSHGDLWVVFVLALLALIVLVARDAIARLPGNLPSPEQMLVGATGLALLLTILGVVQRPSSVYISATPVISQVIHASVGWSYGGWVALVAALVAVIAAFREARPPQPTPLMTILLLRRRGQP
jgi:uncharacterized membrane protein